MKRHAEQSIPQDGKCIRYDRETKDYACYLNGEFIGYAANYSAGEQLCNEVYYAQLTHASAPPEPAPSPEPPPPDPWPLVARAPICATCGNEGDCPDCGTLVPDPVVAAAQARQTWRGITKTLPNGITHRYPELPNVVIGRLADGTVVEGSFDSDDSPLCAWVDWHGFSLCAGDEGIELDDDDGDKGFGHITAAQWARLKRLVESGVVEQVMRFGVAWDRLAQPTVQKAA